MSNWCSERLKNTSGEFNKSHTILILVLLLSLNCIISNKWSRLVALAFFFFFASSFLLILSIFVLYQNIFWLSFYLNLSIFSFEYSLQFFRVISIRSIVFFLFLYVFFIKSKYISNRYFLQSWPLISWDGGCHLLVALIILLFWSSFLPPQLNYWPKMASGFPILFLRW